MADLGVGKESNKSPIGSPGSLSWAVEFRVKAFIGLAPRGWGKFFIRV